MNDLEFVQQLMRANSDSLGFIPISSVNRAYGDGRLLIHAVNNERVGYLLFGPIRKEKDVTIWQLCTTQKERGKGVGRNLLNRLQEIASKAGAKGIRLRCAEDLPANHFWEATGFRVISTVCCKNIRHRRIHIYYLPFNRSQFREVDGC